MIPSMISLQAEIQTATVITVAVMAIVFSQKDKKRSIPEVRVSGLNT
jgi:hypothetical protein